MRHTPPAFARASLFSPRAKSSSARLLRLAPRCGAIRAIVAMKRAGMTNKAARNACNCSATRSNRRAHRMASTTHRAPGR
jgi:hypothetical protein